MVLPGIPLRALLTRRIEYKERKIYISSGSSWIEDNDDRFFLWVLAIRCGSGCCSMGLVDGELESSVNAEVEDDGEDVDELLL